MMDVDSAPTTPAQPAPPGSPVDTDARSTPHNSGYPRLPPRSITTGAPLRPLTSPRPLYPLQPVVASWAAALPPASPSPLIVDRGDTDALKSMLAKLEDQKSFSGFFKLATGSATGRQAAQRCKKLRFLEGSGDVDFANFPSAKNICDAAPNVSDLSINFPVARAMPFEAGLVPALIRLCVDEANGAWTPNHMADTLLALQVERIRELDLHHASSDTVQRCADYLRLVDQYHTTHTYDGGIIGDTRFVFTKELLSNVVTLTLGEWVLRHEVGLVFGVACPPRLSELQIWFGARHSPQADRIRLLDYRGVGRGRCKSLTRLRLSAAPPLGRIPPRDVALRPPLLRALVEDFVGYLRGEDVAINIHFKLELDGVAVEGCDFDCPNPPPAWIHEHSASSS